MNVDDVLDAKGRSVETAFAWQTVEEILALLARRNISSVVVVDADYVPVGMVTDRLIVIAIAYYGGRALKLTAADVMQAPAPSCRPQDSVSRAMALMTNRRVRHLLVMRDGETVGLVSIGDLVKCRLRDAELENGVLRDLVPAWATQTAS